MSVPSDPSTSGPSAPESDLRARLRRALPDAMRARDMAAVAALRSTLAAIENAETADPASAPPALADPATPFASAGEGQPAFAGSVAGVGAAEVTRRSLTAADVERIVRAELAERRDAAATYERAGRADQAARLRHEAGVLARVLGDEDGRGDAG